MNIYTASTFENRLMILMCIEYLKTRHVNLNFTSSWLTKQRAVSFYHDICRDFSDIDNSDMLLAFYPLGKGSMAEIGYAMGQNKPIIAIVDSITFTGKENVTTAKYSDFFPLSRFKNMSISNQIPSDDSVDENERWMIVDDLFTLDKCIYYAEQFAENIKPS